jgi:hypothetical protein
VLKLSTNRRWCLTGTPIQNRLGDLSSLAAFLRLPLASTKAAFEKQILAPLSQDGLGFAGPLRAYLQAFCLRRTEKYLEIPSSRCHIVSLSLSEEERDVYARVLEQARGEIDASVSGTKTLRCSQLFVAILRMRMLCNLGKVRDLPESTSICSRCSIEDDSTTLLLESISVCLDCGRSLLLPKPGNKSGSGLGRGTQSGALKAPRAVDRPSGSVSTNTTPSNFFSTKLSAVVRNILGRTSDAKQ